MAKDYLTGKRVLVVDDEPDVVETAKTLLTMCEVRGATSFSEARELLETEAFDIAVLDIMGVDGYALLEIANQRGVTAVMLTAHALSPDNIVKSFKGGAASYLPKDKLADLAFFLNEILEDKIKGKRLSFRWLERWATFYDKKFGPDWQKKDKDFWDRFPSW